MREINWFFLLSLELSNTSKERKKSFFVSVVFVSILLHFLLRTTRVTLFVILLRGVGVVFIKKDDAVYDDVHCEDASSTPRW